ncbi:hypothetical protein K437DRAFT_11688 [Tilletiaria anomala UBC 951]|uniref:Uncharacterized protein n=1 Tax=Tilletiaria anomala (strain ATCC 24038 / CBS 436.72 / UBC 951) TaxID=1037660 RepID=A0A066VGH7_TILAU|nr:uncharacterized protein K437DRAFT_11688 [Tilletiaria anomala UBC 951]KDN39388.1 hypothetical protein K437DRAFT_11688 [Tilletiaria anomala UBC 951]
MWPYKGTSGHPQLGINIDRYCTIAAGQCRFPSCLGVASARISAMRVWVGRSSLADQRAPSTRTSLVSYQVDDLRFSVTFASFRRPSSSRMWSYNRASSLLNADVDDVGQGDVTDRLQETLLERHRQRRRLGRSLRQVRESQSTVSPSIEGEEVANARKQWIFVEESIEQTVIVSARNDQTSPMHSGVSLRLEELVGQTSLHYHANFRRLTDLNEGDVALSLSLPDDALLRPISKHPFELPVRSW